MKNILYGAGAILTIGYFQIATIAWMAGFDSMAQFITTL